VNTSKTLYTWIYVYDNNNNEPRVREHIENAFLIAERFCRTVPYRKIFFLF